MKDTCHHTTCLDNGCTTFQPCVTKRARRTTYLLEIAAKVFNLSFIFLPSVLSLQMMRSRCGSWDSQAGSDRDLWVSDHQKEALCWRGVWYASDISPQCSFACKIPCDIGMHYLQHRSTCLVKYNEAFLPSRPSPDKRDPTKIQRKSTSKANSKTYSEVDLNTLKLRVTAILEVQ